MMALHMRRVVGVVVLALCVALFVLATRECRSDQASDAPSAGAHIGSNRSIAKAKLTPGSIAGRVLDQRGGAIASAFVCTDDTALPCARTDANGAFVLAALPPAAYSVSATARTFRPALVELRLGPTEQKTIELRLRGGGVETTGIVTDVNGGPIAGARVWSKDAYGETADDGTFSLWTKPGFIAVIAAAEGYANGSAEAFAPGRVELRLLPEGSIAGIVVDARTREPVADAEVELDRDGAPTRSDQTGAFHATKLVPGRYSLTARSPHGYGQTAASVLVGLGAQTSGIVIEMHPAVQVTGKVLVSSTKQPCPDASVELSNAAKVRSVTLYPDLVANGVLPGDYDVIVRCAGYRPRTYPSLQVADRDVTATWEVDPVSTGSIEGTVRTTAGEPIEELMIVAYTPRYVHAGSAFTDTDGHYKITGLAEGSYALQVGVRNFMEMPEHIDQFSVTAGSTLRRDYTVPDIGRIEGRIVGKDAKPLARANARAERNENEELAEANTTADENGVFVFDRLPPGTYVLTAMSALGVKKARATVSVRAKQTTAVTLTIDERTGSISGTVMDAAGKPVADAFVAVVHESTPARYRLDSLNYRDRSPVVTNSDGSFVIPNLPEGTYTVGASRRGSGETTTLDNVALGSSIKLQLERGGSIRGTVHSWNSTLDELSIDVRERQRGFVRREQLFRTGGAFTLLDLPAGHYTITAGAEGKEAVVEIDLAEGEQKANVSIELAAFVTITGRTVNNLTGAPVAEVAVSAMPVMGFGSRFSMIGDPSGGWKSDAAGRFTLRGVPVGRLVFMCSPRVGPFEDTNVERVVSGAGTIDVGDLPVIVMRTPNDEPRGYLGITFSTNEDDRVASTWQLEVRDLDAAGPAAKAGMRIGDVITSIDGLEMRGWAARNAFAVLGAPPGTKFRFVLARGVTIDVVSAPR
jgi:protocatechuate 3,4-dioxygenase beta subunit